MKFPTETSINREQEPLGEPEILTPPDYAADFTRRVNQSDTTDAWFQSMLVTPTAPTVRPMYDALIELQKRGGNAVIVADHFTRMRPDDLPPIAIPRLDGLHKKGREIMGRTQELFDMLTHHGGGIHLTRPPDDINWFFPSYGRNHIKSAGVMSNNGTGAVYIGGVNLYEKGLQSADFMVRFEEQQMVDHVAAAVQTIIDGKLTEDMFIPVTRDYDLLLDSGTIPGRSIIQQAADMLIQQPNATDICVTSQYPLDPLMQTQLTERARDGVAVQVLLPPISQKKRESGVAGMLYQAMAEASKTYPNYRIFHSPKRFVHAKLLHVKQSDGTTDALWGSHNYFLAGYLFRTAEMQLRSRNQSLNKRLHSTYWNMVAGSFYP